MRIVWTKQAEDSFNATIDYLLETWTVKESNNFIDLTEAIIDRVALNPKLVKASVFDKESREAVITKRASLFYRILNNDIIEIEYFWNNYRNPNIKEKTIKQK